MNWVISDRSQRPAEFRNRLDVRRLQLASRYLALWSRMSACIPASAIALRCDGVGVVHGLGAVDDHVF
jgi:hypothetical protein